jgi:hypothetical protein
VVVEVTLSNTKVRSICLFAMFWATETSRLCSLQVMTTGVLVRRSSSFNGLFDIVSEVKSVSD